MRLLGDGSRFGINLTYAQQPSPDGLAQAFLIGEDHIGSDPVALVLGDNIFYGSGLGHQLTRFSDLDGAAVFGYRVANPTEYGVVEFDDSFSAVSLEEKPSEPEERLRRPRPVLLRQRRRRLRPRAEAVRARRAGDHRPQPDLPRAGPADRRGAARAAPPGSTPAPSTPSTTPPTSCAPSRVGRATRSAPPRRSPGGRVSSPTTSSSRSPSRSLKSGYGTYLMELLLHH